MSNMLSKLWAAASLAGLLWMAYWLVFAIGYRDYFTEFDDRGRLVISDIRREDAPADLATPSRIEGAPGVADALPGDLVLDYDGYAISQSDFALHSNWWPSPTASIGLARGSDRFVIVFDKYPGTLSNVIVRWAPIIVSAAVWILGALALFVYKGYQNDSALFAIWCFTLALWLIGDRATLWSVPLSRTVSATLGPLLAPAYIDLALRLVGWRSARNAQRVLKFLYYVFGATALLGLVLVIRASVQPDTLFDLLTYFDVALPLAGLSLLVAPIVLGLGAMRPIANRRLLAWASGVTLVAVLPSLILDILPTLGGGFSRYRDIPIALYVVLPLVYGYLLFRAQNYSLDRLLSRTAILLLLGIVSVLVFATVDIASGGGANESLLVALVTTLGVLFLVGLLYERYQDAIERILYGESRHLEQALVDFTANLPQVNEQADLVNMVLRDMRGRLGVKKAELYLANRSGEVLRFSEDKTAHVQALPVTGASSVLLRQITPHPLWTDSEWAEAALTIVFRSVPVGVVLLGPKPEGEKFNLKEIQYLESMIRLLDLGFERIWLNKAQEEALVQEIGLIARASLDIANDLHDGPVALLEAILLHIDDLRSASHDERLTRLNRSTKEAISQIRSIVDSVRPRILTESTKLILQEAIDGYRKTMPGIRLDSAISLDYGVRLSLPANDALYRIVRGALQNILQHSKATQVWVIAECRDGKVLVTIEDNGVGVQMPHSLTRTELVKAGHFGIQFFYDYAASAGGACRVGPGRSGGTLVEVVLPIMQDQVATSTAGTVAAA